MRWYLNDTSLQGQYDDAAKFRAFLGGLVSLRARFGSLRVAMHTTRSLASRIVGANKNFREYLQDAQFRDLRAAVFAWLDKTGPFLEDDRAPEEDDYFECLQHDVTNAGLGEAARRIKREELAMSISFCGGPTNFCI